MLGSLVSHEIQACIAKQCTIGCEVVGVGSSLKAPKKKGEGDGSETFHDACDVDKV